MSNSTYDKAKWVALTLLPALSALYVALAASLGWGHVDAVVGTIAAVDTFLGTLLGISRTTPRPPTVCCTSTTASRKSTPLLRSRRRTLPRTRPSLWR